jgi:hypothetical protein
VPVQLQLAPGVVLDESTVEQSPMLPYLRMLVRLIEGIEVSVRQLIELLRQALRQHRIASRSRRDYVVGFLRRHPP